jgi:hypothetical protein
MVQWLLLCLDIVDYGLVVIIRDIHSVIAACSIKLAVPCLLVLIVLKVLSFNLRLSLLLLLLQKFLPSLDDRFGPFLIESLWVYTIESLLIYYGGFFYYRLLLRFDRHFLTTNVVRGMHGVQVLNGFT